MISVESPRAVYQPTQPQRGSLRPRPQSAPTARTAPDPQAASKWRSNGSPVTAGDRRKEEYVHEQARLRADSLREAHRQRQLRRSYAPPSFASGPLHSARTAQQPQTPVHNLLEDLGAEGAAARQRVTRLLAENARLRAEAARLSERAQRAELLQAEVMQLQARLRAEERARQAAEAVAREVMAAEARLRGGVAADGEVAALEEEISAAQAAAERTARAAARGRGAAGDAGGAGLCSRRAMGWRLGARGRRARAGRGRVGRGSSGAARGGGEGGGGRGGAALALDGQVEDGAE